MMHTPNHRAITSTGRPVPLPSPSRASVARMLGENPEMGTAERCLAVLLAKGVTGDELAALCHMTRPQLRDVLESIQTRIDRRQMRLERERRLRAGDRRQKQAGDAP